jgi:hypothetical protein
MMVIRRGLASLFALTAAFGLTVFGPREGWPQEKQKISFNVPAADARYTKQYVIDVGDVRGHQIRIFELHRTYSAGPPVFAGVKVVESWTRGYSDYVNLNGRVWGYGVFVLENGDKIFSQYDGASQTTVNPDGEWRSTATTVSRLIGGTGKFRAIQGTLKAVSVFDPSTGFNDAQTEGEYWIEKE